MKRALGSFATLFANPKFNRVDQLLNYNVVVEVLYRSYDRIDFYDSSVWVAFQEVCRHLQREDIDRITVPQGWSNLTEDQFKRVLSVRCDLVKHSSVERSWLWLNAVVDNVDNNPMYAKI